MVAEAPWYGGRLAAAARLMPGAAPGEVRHGPETGFRCVVPAQGWREGDGAGGARACGVVGRGWVWLAAIGRWTGAGAEVWLVEGAGGTPSALDEAGAGAWLEDGGCTAPPEGLGRWERAAGARSWRRAPAGAQGGNGRAQGQGR